MSHYFQNHTFDVLCCCKDNSRFDLNTLFIKTELKHIYILQVPDDMCHETWETNINVA